MPCRVYVRIKGVSKPDVLEHGAIVSKDEERGDITVKDAADEVIGWYRAENVEAWWLEREPFDISRLSEKDLQRVVKELTSNAAIWNGIPQETLDRIKREAQGVTGQDKT